MSFTYQSYLKFSRQLPCYPPAEHHDSKPVKSLNPNKPHVSADKCSFGRIWMSTTVALVSNLLMFLYECSRTFISLCS